MKQWEIREQFGLDNLRMTEADEPSPGQGEIKIRLRAMSLNYRDLVVVQGAYGKALKPPVIPGSDGAGEVVEVGLGVSRFKVGDRVCPIFFPDWIEGEPSEAVLRMDRALGASRNGMFCEFAVVNEKSAVKVPQYLSFEEAAAIPCAGVTAWNTLTYGRSVKSGETVLVQGTGGVSIWALQLAKMLGAKVIITSSSDEKLERAKGLGADATINYATNPEWHQEVRKLVPSGVDRVIEVGGADTLPKSIKAVRGGGVISSVGVLSGVKASLELGLVVMRFVRLEGVTVGSREHFEALLAAMEPSQMKPVIGNVLSFGEVPMAFDQVKRGGTFGKLCITV